MIVNRYTCTIPDYPVEVKVSEKRRELYWKKGEKLPKKHVAQVVGYDSDGYCLDAAKNRITKNVKTAGKPRLLTINAQKIYVGVHHSVRSKIVNELHELFNAAFKAQFPKKIDIKDKKILVHLHFYDIYTPKLPDLDNLANLFVKAGIDCLTTANNPNQTKSSGYTHKLGILPDDKMAFIPHIAVEFTNVTKADDRKLTFSLFVVNGDFSIEKILEKAWKDDQKVLSLQDGKSEDTKGEV